MHIHMEKLYPVFIGPILDVFGNYRGEGYFNQSDPSKVLIKNPFTYFMEETEIPPLLEQWYQFPAIPKRRSGEMAGSSSAMQSTGVSISSYSKED